MHWKLTLSNPAPNLPLARGWHVVILKWSVQNGDCRMQTTDGVLNADWVQNADWDQITEYVKNIKILKIATRKVTSRTGDITHDNLCLWVVSAFSEIAMSANRSVGSSKFYLRKTVAWQLCLRHDIFKNEQGIYKMYRNRICTLTRISKQQYYTKFFKDNDFMFKWGLTLLWSIYAPIMPPGIYPSTGMGPTQGRDMSRNAPNNKNGKKRT